MKVVTTIALIALAVSPAHAWHDEASVKIARLNQRIANAPQRASLYLERADLYRLVAVWDRALADCDRAAELEPEIVGPELVRARIGLARGAPRAARVHVERHLAAHPNDVEAVVVRARIEATLGRNRAAIRGYGRAIALCERPAPELYVDRAALGFELGPQFADETLADLDAAEARLGFVPALQAHALELELEYGRVEAALERLDRLTEHVPPRESWLCRRGEILLNAGRADAAQTAFRAAFGALAERPARRSSTPAMAALRGRITAGLRAARPTSAD